MRFPALSWRKKTVTPRLRRTPSRNRPSIETLALAGPSNQLNGILKRDINPDTGVASFTDLAVVTAGDGYTLQATNAAVSYPF